MSQTIDNRIVEMQFENKQFESGVQESLSTLDKLKNALKFDDASKNLQDFSKNINKNVDLSGLSKSIEDVSSKFSVSGIAGMEVIRKLTDFAMEAGKTIAHALDAPFAQIRQGGWKRAMNIEDAKFQLKGLGVAWESVSSDIDYAVADTAYGLDVAAKACAQLSASSVRAGDDMKAALRGISGVAAMGNTEYENISRIFTKAAGNGKVMAMELNQISQYGLNARASLRDFFNTINEGTDEEKLSKIPEDIQEYVKSISKGCKVTEGDINEFVHDSEIDFRTFSYAMDSAFGEHAKKANETFFGALSNIKAALSKIGAEFATPIIQGAIPVFNQIRIFLNDLRKQMGPVFETFKRLTEILSDKVTAKLRNFRTALLGEDGFGLPMHNLMEAFNNLKVAVIRIVAAISTAFKEVFPQTRDMSESLVSITEGIANFTKRLIASDTTLIVFKNILVLVLTALKNIGNVISFLLPIAGKVVSIVMTIVLAVGKLVGGLITLIKNLNIVQNTMTAIQKAGGLFAYVIDRIKDVFGKLKDILSDTTTVTGKFFAKLKEVATIAVVVIGGSLYLAFMKIKELFSYFDTHDPLGSLLEGLNKLKSLPIIKTVIGGIELAFGAIGVAISKVIGLIKDFINNLKSGMSVAKAFGTTIVTALGGVVSTIGGLADKIKTGVTDLFKSFSKDRVIEETIEAPMANANLALKGVEKTLTKTGSEVKKVTSAFDQGRGTLRDYQYQVANTKTGLDKAKDAMAKFGAKVLEKIKSIKVGQVLLFAFSTTIIMLTANLVKLVKSLTGVTDGISGIIDNFKDFGKRKSTFLDVMLGIALGITALTAAIYTMSQLPSDKLQQVVVSLGALLTVIGLFSVLSKDKSSGFALAMASFSGSVLLLVAALQVLNQIKTNDIKDLWIRFGILASIMGTMAVISAILAKIAPEMTKGAISMLGFAGSIYILAKALDVISKANLQNIQNNWVGLTMVILAFAAFASIASNVGMTAALSLISFLAVMKLLISNAETLKKMFGSLENALQYIADVAKSAIRYVYNGLKQAAEDMQKNEMLAKLIGGSVTAIIVGLTSLILALGHAGKGMKKAAVGFALTIAAIAGLMYATVKIAEFAQSVDPTCIANATSLLQTIFGFLSLLALLSTEIQVGKKLSIKANEDVIKQIRKLLGSMALLVVSIGAFAAMTGTLTSDEMTRVKGLLEDVIILIGVIAAVIATITAIASKGGKSEISFTTFAGIVLLLGSLIGSLAVLMFMFSTIDWERDKQMLITAGAAFGAIALSLIFILAQVAKIEQARGRKNQKEIRKTVWAYAAMITAIGGLVILINREFNGNGGWAEAARYAGILVGSLAAITVMIIALEGFSKKFLNTEIRQDGFKKTLKAVNSMILAIIGFGAIFLGLKYLDVNTWEMLAQAGILVGMLAVIVLLVREIQKFSKDTKYTFTKKSSENFDKTMKYIGLAIAAIAALAFIFAKLRTVDAGRMAGQALTLVGTLVALSAVVLGIEKFMKKANVKNIMKVEGTIGIMIGAFTILALLFKFIIDNFNSSPGDLLKKSQTIILVLGELALLVYAINQFMSKADIAKIMKVEATLGIMIGIFTALAAVFKFLINNMTDPVGMIAKSQIIMLALYELAGLVTLCGVIAKLGAKIAGGEVALIAMVGIFAVLTQVFKVIDRLKTEGIMAKSQTIILVLTELGVLMALCGVLASTMLTGLIGGVGLIAMVGIFAVLAQVFKVIDGLKTEGIMKKSQTIILVLTELIALVNLCGLLSGVMIVGLIGEVGLVAMVGIFYLLAQVFTVIDGMHTEGLLAKSQAIVLVLTELCGLSVLSILSVIALAGAPGLKAMVDVFGMLSQVFLLIDQMHLEGLAEKADIIVTTLLKLEGLSAIGGFIGTVLGPGLLVFADGVRALGSACAVVGSGLEKFVISLERLVATGPRVQAWCTSVATGITTLTVSVTTSLSALSKSVVDSINTLIVGVSAALASGAAVLYGASSALGAKIVEGIKNKIKEIVNIPKDILVALGNGIKGIGPKLVEIGKSMGTKLVDGFRAGTGWHSPPEFLINFFKDAASTILSEGGDITSILNNLGGNWGETLSSAFGNFDWTNIGFDKVMQLVNGLKSGEGNLMSEIMRLMGMMDQLTAYKNKISSSWAKDVGTLSEFEYGLKEKIAASNREIEKQNLILKRANPTVKGGAKAIADAKKKIEEETLAIQYNTDKLNGLLGKEVAVEEETKELGTSLGGLGDDAKKGAKGVKEASDEIADFYDSIQGAISLFEEFNKETELTSDKLIENMRSQISGITEWSNQIQQLAFMGIDQGLLQQLAEMGPQGYEYTNAFVHMTAEQLAEANNLYHQSLMLPAKVTSQVYGSYTIAGRSAASGFLMGMQQEDIKSAAVGFAHQVVDQMNMALDIQAGKSMVTYEDGVAVVNGVKTGMSAADMQAALGKATDLLTKENIKDKFQKGLFDNKYIYNVGTNITLGLAQGIKDEDANNALRGAVISAIDVAKNAAVEATKEHSPSKVFDKIGRFITLGLAQGITAETEAAIHAMDETADSIIGTMRDTINKANEALVNDVDDPVIKPVLDLSNIQEGSRELDNMLSRNSAFSASRSFNNLQNEQWGNQSALLNATMDNTDIVDAVTSLNEEVATLKDVMTNIKVVLDTGTMVGAMTPAIDQSLGMRQVLAGRGI